jgi:sugar phosphate isomerase/epimerase
MWSKDNYRHMEEFVQEAGEFGFTQVELNSILTPERLRELLEVEGIRVSSVHCPCPTTFSPRGIWAPDLLLSALDKETRSEAVEFGKRAIKLASEIGARAVILHAGQVELEFALEKRLHQLYNQGLASSKEFAETKERLIEERSSKASDYFETAEESIYELVDFASEKGIVLGLENRVHYYEMPSLEEMEQLLTEFAGKPVGYWHDVGHAGVQSRLGFTPHHEWFTRLGNKIIGAHLHDAIGIRDHCAPGIGSLDWKLVAKNLSKGAIKVCEIGEWNKVEDVRQAVPFLKNNGVLP